MRPQDAVTRILELAPQLDPALMRLKLAEFQRGGLPGSSMSDGRGGQPPLPMLGDTDRSILTDRRLYESEVTHAVLALESALRLQNAWCIPRTDDTEKAEKLKDDLPKGAGACSNVWCTTVCTGLGNDRLRHGRCRPCYRVFTLEGRDRDPRRVDQLTNGGDAA